MNQPIIESVSIANVYVCDALKETLKENKFDNMDFASMEFGQCGNILDQIINLLEVPSTSDRLRYTTYQHSRHELIKTLRQGTAQIKLQEIQETFRKSLIRPEDVPELLNSQTYESIERNKRLLQQFALRKTNTQERNVVSACQESLKKLSQLFETLRKDFLPHRRFSDSSRMTNAIAGFEKVFKEVLDFYQLLQKCSLSKPSMMEALFSDFKLLLQYLIENSFIINGFPQNGIIKKQTKGAAGTKVPVTLVSLLPFSRLGLLAKDLDIKVYYVEGTANISHEHEIPEQYRLKASWKPSNSNARNVFTFMDLKLTTTESAAATNSSESGERVTERKGVFVFTSNLIHLRYHKVVLPEAKILCISDTVIPIVHSNQEPPADFHLFLDSFFPLPCRQDFSVLETAPVEDVVKSISKYFSLFTGRALDLPGQMSFLKKKLLETCGSGHNSLIQLQRLNVPLLNPPGGGSLWSWIWNCAKMFRESKEKSANLQCLRDMWVNGLIIGFIDKAEAASMNLKANRPGSFVLRFSETVRNSICVTVGSQSWKPFTFDELKVKSLADELMSYPSLMYFTHEPDHDKQTSLANFATVSDESNSGGYTRRGFVFSDESMQDLEANMPNGDCDSAILDNLDDFNLMDFELDY